MEPQEKADELIEKFIPSTKVFYNNDWKTDLGEAKKCALIVVDEILGNYLGYTGPEYYSCNNDELICDEAYWQEVKDILTKR